MNTPFRTTFVLAVAGVIVGCAPVTELVSEGELAGDCTDGVDNDGDQAVDCDDAGCVFTDDCEVLAGDTDADQN
jgi:hypothetical protein